MQDVLNGFMDEICRVFKFKSYLSFCHVNPFIMSWSISSFSWSRDRPCFRLVLSWSDLSNFLKVSKSWMAEIEDQESKVAIHIQWVQHIPSYCPSPSPSLSFTEICYQPPLQICLEFHFNLRKSFGSLADPTTEPTVTPTCFILFLEFIPGAA